MAAGMTRGPLPAEVYWRRRLMLLGLALLVVVGLARVLGNGSDGSDGAGAAAENAAAQSAAPSGGPSGGPTSGTPSPSPAPGASAAGSPTPQTGKERRQQAKAEKKAQQEAAEAAAAAQASASAAAAAAAALPDPQGPCSDTDVVVTPSLPSPVAGSDVAIVLDLGTRFSPACSWTISPDQLALKVTSGKDEYWSTRECPQAVPTQDLVLRRAVSTQVQIVWNGKRSDTDCSGRTTWALPGFYHVLVAALAGEPSDLQFELTAPVPAEITRTVEPKSPKSRQQQKAQKQQG